jgi:hypothetical protein
MIGWMGRKETPRAPANDARLSSGWTSKSPAEPRNARRATVRAARHARASGGPDRSLDARGARGARVVARARRRPQRLTASTRWQP